MSRVPSYKAFQVIRILSKTNNSKMASDSENTMITMEDTAAKQRLTQSIGLEDIISSLKTFEAAELFKLLKAVASEADKKATALQKQVVASQKIATKTAATKKTGSMPKGAIPPQLKKPRAWVEFTLKDALENGWESFTVIQKKKDKETNTVTEEQIEMPGSILHNGAHIYKGSVTEKTPDGKQLIHKEAMSLSKQRKESSHATYSEFEAQYVDETTDDDKSVASSTSSKKIVVKKTAAEKEAEAAAKKAEKEAEKEAKKAEKDATKAAKKAEKDAEKEAKKTEKPVVKPVTPVVKPVTPVVKPVTPVVKAAAPVDAPVAVPKKKKVAKSD